MPTPKERMVRLRERHLNGDMSVDEYNRAMARLLYENPSVDDVLATRESLFTRIWGKLFH